MSDSHTANGRFIVDNSDTDGKVGDYLKKWCALSRTVDIAAGYFEIGALLALGEKWLGVKRLRILMGDEVSFRTQRAFAEGFRKIQQHLEASAEEEKRRNDFLEGCRPLSRRCVPAKSSAGFIGRRSFAPSTT